MGAFSSSTSRQEVLAIQDQSDRVVTRPRPTSPISTASSPGPPARAAAGPGPLHLVVTKLGRARPVVAGRPGGCRRAQRPARRALRCGADVRRPEAGGRRSRQSSQMGAHGGQGREQDRQRPADALVISAGRRRVMRRAHSCSTPWATSGVTPPTPGTCHRTSCDAPHGCARPSRSGSPQPRRARRRAARLALLAGRGTAAAGAAADDVAPLIDRLQALLPGLGRRPRSRTLRWCGAWCA